MEWWLSFDYHNCLPIPFQLITPQRLEVIKASIIDEMDQVYKERTKKQEAEVEDYRSALSKVRYELSFLKAEYEHNKADFQQQMEDVTKQQDIEVNFKFYGQYNCNI